MWIPVQQFLTAWACFILYTLSNTVLAVSKKTTEHDLPESKYLDWSGFNKIYGHWGTGCTLLTLFTLWDQFKVNAIWNNLITFHLLIYQQTENGEKRFDDRMEQIKRRGAWLERAGQKWEPTRPCPIREIPVVIKHIELVLFSQISSVYNSHTVSPQHYLAQMQRVNISCSLHPRIQPLLAAQ